MHGEPLIEAAPRRTALVTGGSRGIGAEIARLLAVRGLDVAINYRSKSLRARGVAERVKAAGREALLLQADLTDPEAVRRMAATVGEQWGHLDALVLNASGGLEQGSPAGYAAALNHHAQVRTVDELLPLMRAPGGCIAFVTSHWAHFYGKKPIFAAYLPIAESKRRGEDALRARIPELAARGVRLLVASGDLIEGTSTPRLLERAKPGVIAIRRRQIGRLPTVGEFATAIVDATLDPRLATGHTVFVGDVD